MTSPSSIVARRRLSGWTACSEVLGDRAQLAKHRTEFEHLQPDVVVDMLAFTREGAESFVSTLSGIAGRAVVVSSADVYLAYGRLHHTEPGPIEQVPLTEDSPLRQKLGPEGEAYDKTGVEEVVRGATELPSTIVRYPAIYGPGDGQRRFFVYARRMADQRPAIILGESEAEFRFSHAYAEDAAHAVVLAATNEGAIGRVYNVAELITPTWLERVHDLAAAAAWNGQVVVVRDEQATLPQHHTQPDLNQPLVLDSSRIRSELGYREVVAYEDGLRRTCDWLLTQPPGTSSPEQFDYAAEDRLLASRAGS